MPRRLAEWLSAAAVGALAGGFLLLTFAPPPASAALGPGSFTRQTHPGVEGTGPRDYVVYRPSATAGAGRPLVVFLHGCLQNAMDVAVGTRWTELAERVDAVVVFPEQPTTANIMSCWNWFEAKHQGRDAGEPAVLAAITKDAVAATGADPDRVYVMGISAGADMAMILGATHPDVFAAVGGFAGCAYATCADVTGALAHRQMGSRARVLPAFLVQGTLDPLNDFAMGETMARQWVGTNDLADDGAANASISPVPSRVDHVGFDQSALAGVGTVGDPCVRNRQYPCAGALVGARSYPYSVEHHADRSGCDVVDFWIVQGLSHDYPNGDPKGTFTDPIGPDITTAAYDYFTRHTLGRPCGALRAASVGGAGAPERSRPPETAPPPPVAPPPAPGSTLPATGAASAPASWAAFALVSASGCRRLLRERFRRPHPRNEGSSAA